MSERKKCNYVFWDYKNSILAMMLSLFSGAAVASDPSGLFWPLIIGSVFLGILLFCISAAFIIYWVDNKHLKMILLGFSFGLFLGPIHTAHSAFVPNIIHLVTGVGNKGIMWALIYASMYSTIISILYIVFTRVKRKLKRK